MITTDTKVKLSKDHIMLIIIAGVASYLDAALAVSLGVSLPVWAKYLNLNSWLVGLLSTTLTVMIAVGAFIGGKLSDQFGRVTVFNIDIFFVAVGSAVMVFSDHFTGLMVGAAITGLASGADLPTSLAVISERTSREAYGRAISSTQIFWSVGIILSQFIGFLTANYGMGSPKILFGFIGVIAFVNWSVRVFSKNLKTIESNLVTSVKEEDHEAAGEAGEKIKIRDLFKNNHYLVPLILLTLFYLFWNLPANTWGSFINYFLVTVDHQSQMFSTMVAMTANILSMILVFIYLRISDSKYRYKAMYAGIAIAFLSFAAAGTFSGNWQIFTFAYICYCLSTVLCGEPIYKVWCQSFYPVNARATMTGFSYGIVRACTAVFSIATPTLMGYSPSLLLWILMGCTVIFGLCAISIVQLIRRLNISDPAINKGEVNVLIKHYHQTGA
ncbi:MFS transporter [Sporolactobacillus sp. Y61]|uniref:MFS transporter n=1 Tax=Sporolactobacillus sp. Y61 TaxID=3160863 RepID=A0AAU8III0_9BACL